MIAVTLDMPKAERISRNLHMVTGILTFSGTYPTNGELLTDVSKWFRKLLRMTFDQKSGFLFEFDKTNNKVKVLHPTKVAAAHAHDLEFKGTAAANAVTMAANSLRNASAGALTVVGGGADGGILTGGAISAAAGTEFPTGALTITGVSFIAIGLA